MEHNQKHRIQWQFGYSADEFPEFPFLMLAIKHRYENVGPEPAELMIGILDNPTQHEPDSPSLRRKDITHQGMCMNVRSKPRSITSCCESTSQIVSLETLATAIVIDARPED
jgi:hypothetical protein